jgi:hypothetical protein
MWLQLEKKERGGGVQEWWRYGRLKYKITLTKHKPVLTLPSIVGEAINLKVTSGQIRSKNRHML